MKNKIKKIIESLEVKYTYNGMVDRIWPFTDNAVNFHEFDVVLLCEGSPVWESKFYKGSGHTDLTVTLEDALTCIATDGGYVESYGYDKEELIDSLYGDVTLDFEPDQVKTWSDEIWESCCKASDALKEVFGDMFWDAQEYIHGEFS